MEVTEEVLPFRNLAKGYFIAANTKLLNNPVKICESPYGNDVVIFSLLHSNVH
jgi:glycine cleavage system H lipoate-binding protein